MFVNTMAFGDLAMQGAILCDATRLHSAVAIHNGYMMS